MTHLYIPYPRPVEVIPDALATAHGAYVRERGAAAAAAGAAGRKDVPVVLFIVQPTERNVVDQRCVARVFCLLFFVLVVSSLFSRRASSRRVV